MLQEEDFRLQEKRYACGTYLSAVWSRSFTGSAIKCFEKKKQSLETIA